ncbi:MAG: type II secretion system protein GspL [Burkholderiaceae bacterium]|nr:type II secretion system protein GspL [Burkholderiaceae bacterium]
MSKLIVFLPWRLPNSGASHSPGAPAGTASAPVSASLEYSYALANDANGLISSGTAPLNLLPQADKTILVAPAQALSWHQIDLPKIPKARLRAALDGLLEDRLLDDTSAMSFALSPDAPVGKATAGVWVVACDKAWLTGSIHAFEAAGCRVTQVVPEFWPVEQTVVCVTGSLEDAWLTRAAPDGVLTVPLRAQGITGSINALLADFPSDAAVLAEPAVAALAEQSLARQVVLRQSAAGLLQSAQSLWELAQFEQRLSGDGEGIKRLRRAWQTFWQTAAWRPARWGLVAVLLANIIGLNAWAWQQQSALTAKRALLGKLLTQTFPGVKVVVDAPLQMAKEMTLLRQATGAISAQNFEAILSSFGTSVVINTAPNAIEFAATTVNFKGLKLADNELSMAKAKLKNLGYTLSVDGDTTRIKAETMP